MTTTSSSPSHQQILKSIHVPENQSDEDVELRDAVLEFRAANSRRHAGDPGGKKFSKCMKLMTKRDDEDISPHEREAVEDELREALSEYKAAINEGKQAGDDTKLTKFFEISTNRALQEAEKGIPSDGQDTYAKMARYAGIDGKQCPLCAFKTKEPKDMMAHKLTHFEGLPDLPVVDMYIVMHQLISKLGEIENFSPESVTASHKLFDALVYKNSRMLEDGENEPED